MAEESTIKLQFAPEQKSPTLEINNGNYDRKFEAKDSPFECSQEEAAMLLRTRFFVLVPVTEQPKAEAEAEIESPVAPVDQPTNAAPAPVVDASKKAARGRIGGAPTDQ